MGKTKIEWSDMSWPVVTGCTHAGGPGCDNCYAAQMAATRLKHHPRYEGLATIENGKTRWTGEVRLNHDVLGQPLHWRKPRMVFVASMGDLFHKDVPDSFIFDMLEVVAQCPQHTFQVLTKRPKRMAHLWRNASENAYPNLWLGTSVENQAAADERIPWLRRTPAAVRFASVEPMLSAVNLRKWLYPKLNTLTGGTRFERLAWVICGGESGPGARPMHPNWAQSLKDQCQAVGVPFFFKQWGAWMPYSKDKHEGTLAIWQDRADWKKRMQFLHVSGVNDPCYKETTTMVRVGKKAAGRLLDGQVWDQFPVNMP